MENSYLNKTNKPTVLSIVTRKSGTGKTTLIEALIKIFKDRGYRVGVLKYDAHKFEIDKEGKDSYRFTKAGADNVILSSAEKLAMIQLVQEQKNLEEIIELFTDVDVIFIEGFRNNNYPKIEVYRKAVSEKLLCKDSNFNIDSFVAVASDESLSLDLPVLDLNSPLILADFIENNLIQKVKSDWKKHLSAM